MNHLQWVQKRNKANFQIQRLHRVSWCFCDWVASWFRFPWWGTIFHFLHCKLLPWRRLWLHSFDGCQVSRQGRQRQSCPFRFSWWVWIVHEILFGWGKFWEFLSTEVDPFRGATKLAKFLGSRIRSYFPWWRIEFRMRREYVLSRGWSFWSKFRQLIFSWRKGGSLLRNKGAFLDWPTIWGPTAWEFERE